MAAHWLLWVFVHIPRTLKLNPLPGRAFFRVGCCNVALSFVIGIINWYNYHLLVSLSTFRLFNLFVVRKGNDFFLFAVHCLHLIVFISHSSHSHCEFRMSYQIWTRLSSISNHCRVGISHAYCVPNQILGVRESTLTVGSLFFFLLFSFIRKIETCWSKTGYEIQIY